MNFKDFQHGLQSFEPFGDFGAAGSFQAKADDSIPNSILN